MSVTWQRVLAFAGILPIGPTIWFVLFWNFFGFWRKNRAFAYAVMASTFVAWAVIAYVFEHWTWFGGRLDMPVWARGIGWSLIAVSAIFGWVADRQIGFRVRSFLPFFSQHGRIRLKTTGAYGIVRHPIYAAGRVFAFGVFLVTGYPSVLLAWAVWGLGSIWFSRQEERRLMTLLDDPLEYERYRRRVPGLFPSVRRR
jgi:protein-S-isoprenylcysteine O-methyltransferase Ste14